MNNLQIINNIWEKNNLKLNKKAVGVGQLFTFIVVALTFALIAIFGFKAVSDFLNYAQDVEFVQFKESLEKDIKTIYTEAGSVRFKEYSIPSQYSQICFVNMGYSDINDERLEALRLWDPVASSVWKIARDGGYDAVDSNVFLQPDAPKIKVHDILIENGFLCTAIQRGKLSLRLEGKGDRTQISLP